MPGLIKSFDGPGPGRMFDMHDLNESISSNKQSKAKYKTINMYTVNHALTVIKFMLFLLLMRSDCCICQLRPWIKHNKKQLEVILLYFLISSKKRI